MSLVVSDTTARDQYTTKKGPHVVVFQALCVNYSFSRRLNLKSCVILIPSLFVCFVLLQLLKGESKYLLMYSSV